MIREKAKKRALEDVRMLTCYYNIAFEGEKLRIGEK